MRSSDSYMCLYSDSGDSLFLTQKTGLEPVRTNKRRHCRSRSPTSARDLEESKEDTSSSYQGESRTGQRKTGKKFRLPRHSFSFLTEKKWKPKSTGLPTLENKKLHVRITKRKHILMLTCCFVTLKHFLYRIIQWEASSNVSESCGRAIKEDLTLCSLCQHLT